ncbi:MAG: molybdopterin-guanine dinucleotide biosynthesis protein MobB, partial [Rhodospirillales bacterium]|nr:molybdopterin-guanine dinucleotide biosynthesis protein MobB [Rhodospirillales bacterium]
MRRFGVTGLSDSGKTTLVCRLLPRLRERGLRVATVKHAHHGFDLLPEGHPAQAWRGARAPGRGGGGPAPLAPQRG